MTARRQVNFRDWIEAPWFKGGARIAMFVGGAMLPIASGIGVAILLRIGSVEAAVATVTAKQLTVSDALAAQERISAEFRSDVRAEFADTQDGVEALQGTVGALQNEISKITGILEGMQRRAVAGRQLGPFEVSP